MNPRMRVASYNLRSLRDDASAAARVVRAIEPDVLLLQEVPRHPGAAARIRAFAGACGLYWPGRTRWVAGTSVMTSCRARVDTRIDRRLEVRDPVWRKHGNPRGYSVVRLWLADRPIVAVSIHLSLLPDERVSHVDRLRQDLADDPWTQGGVPVVIGGDLNETAVDPAWRALSAAWVQISPPVATFPAHHPHRAIDAIFATPTLEVIDPHPDEPGPDPDDLRAATDHRPVWVDLLLG